VRDRQLYRNTFVTLPQRQARGSSFEALANEARRHNMYYQTHRVTRKQGFPGREWSDWRFWSESRMVSDDSEPSLDAVAALPYITAHFSKKEFL
jgi:hypothetical protein